MSARNIRLHLLFGGRVRLYTWRGAHGWPHFRIGDR
jgi:hypothetical protein